MRAVCLLVCLFSAGAGSAQGYEYHSLRPELPTINLASIPADPFDESDLQPGWLIEPFDFPVKARAHLGSDVYDVRIPANTPLVVRERHRAATEMFYEALFIAATSTPLSRSDICVPTGLESAGQPVWPSALSGGHEDACDLKHDIAKSSVPERSCVDLHLRSNLLSMQRQDGKAHEAGATIWLNSGFGLTGQYFRSQECDSIIQPLGLHDGERRWLAGIAFRTGTPAAGFDRLAFGFGSTTLLGGSAPSVGLEANAHLGPTSYELLAYGTRRSGNDAWLRGRAELTVYSENLFDLAFGGQYVNRSFSAPTGSTEVPSGFRYFNSSGGGYVALGTGYENARFRFVAGVGKGSAPKYDYVEFEAELTWQF